MLQKLKETLDGVRAVPVQKVTPESNGHRAYVLDHEIDPILESDIGTPENLEAWKNHFWTVLETDQYYIGLLTPLTPYTDIPGGHAMFCLRPKPNDKDGTKSTDFVRNIGEVSPEDLAQILSRLEMAALSQFKVLSSFEDKNGNIKYPNLRTYVALNCHIDPIKINTAQAQVHLKNIAQSVEVLHFHVFSLRAEEEYNHFDLSQIDEDQRVKILKEVHDPIVSLFLDLIGPDILGARISQLIPEVYLDHIEPSGTIVLKTTLPDPEDEEYMSDEKLAEIIKIIHATFANMYTQVTNCFVDRHKTDAIGYPMLLPPAQILSNLKTLIARMNEQHILTDKEIKKLQVLARALHPAEQEVTKWTSQNGHGPKQRDRIFLGGPAYTLTWCRLKTHQLEIRFSPHIDSNGNALNSLNLVRVVQPADEELPGQESFSDEFDPLAELAEELKSVYRH